jgi:Fic family protein
VTLLGVDADRFDSAEFGDVVVGDSAGINWFRPRPIPRQLNLEDQTLLALSRADEALGKLAGVANLLPNPRLLMGPYAYKEALASSRIEGTQADLEGVLQAARQGSERDPEVLTVQNYRRALQTGLDKVLAEGRLTLETVMIVHEVLLADPHTSGAVRDRPVWLGSPTDRPETAVFVPPVGDALAESLLDWESYLASPPPVPALIRASLLHYQFLTVHPFLDGNGRTGRLLVLLFLAAEGRLPVPLLYISPFFERRRREYYDRLQAVRENGEIQQWCQFFLRAVEAQANDGASRARNIFYLRERYRAELAGSRNRSSEVVEMLFENPYLMTGAVKEQLGVSTQGALNLIRSLEARGWLRQMGTSGRGGGALWVASEIFDTMADDILEPATPVGA